MSAPTITQTTKEIFKANKYFAEFFKGGKEDESGAITVDGVFISRIVQQSVIKKIKVVLNSHLKAISEEEGDELIVKKLGELYKALENKAQMLVDFGNMSKRQKLTYDKLIEAVKEKSAKIYSKMDCFEAAYADVESAELFRTYLSVIIKATMAVLGIKDEGRITQEDRDKIVARLKKIYEKDFDSKAEDLKSFGAALSRKMVKNEKELEELVVESKLKEPKLYTMQQCFVDAFEEDEKSSVLNDAAHSSKAAYSNAAVGAVMLVLGMDSKKPIIQAQHDEIVEELKVLYKRLGSEDGKLKEFCNKILGLKSKIKNREEYESVISDVVAPKAEKFTVGGCLAKVFGEDNIVKSSTGGLRYEITVRNKDGDDDEVLRIPANYLFSTINKIKEQLLKSGEFSDDRVVDELRSIKEEFVRLEDFGKFCHYCCINKDKTREELIDLVKSRGVKVSALKVSGATIQPFSRKSTSPVFGEAVITPASQRPSLASEADLSLAYFDGFDFDDDGLYQQFESEYAARDYVVERAEALRDSQMQQAFSAPGYEGYSHDGAFPTGAVPSSSEIGSVIPKLSMSGAHLDSFDIDSIFDDEFTNFHAEECEEAVEERGSSPQAFASPVDHEQVQKRQRVK